MLNNNKFKDCYITKLGNDIKAMVLIDTKEDVKTKLTYYMYKDFLTGIDYIVYEDIMLHKISYYMDDEELDNFVLNNMSDNDKLNVIARAIKEEQDNLKIDIDNALKKILKP